MTRRFEKVVTRVSLQLHRRRLATSVNAYLQLPSSSFSSSWYSFLTISQPNRNCYVRRSTDLHRFLNYIMSTDITHIMTNKKINKKQFDRADTAAIESANTTFTKIRDDEEAYTFNAEHGFSLFLSHRVKTVRNRKMQCDSFRFTYTKIS
jgi:hypothetical protein